MDFNFLSPQNFVNFSIVQKTWDRGISCEASIFDLIQNTTSGVSSKQKSLALLQSFVLDKLKNCDKPEYQRVLLPLNREQYERFEKCGAELRSSDRQDSLMVSLQKYVFDIFSNTHENTEVFTGVLNLNCKQGFFMNDEDWGELYLALWVHSKTLKKKISTQKREKILVKASKVEKQTFKLLKNGKFEEQFGNESAVEDFLLKFLENESLEGLFDLPSSFSNFLVEGFLLKISKKPKNFKWSPIVSAAEEQASVSDFLKVSNFHNMEEELAGVALDGCSLLHLAVENGEVKTVGNLLSLKSSPNSQDAQGLTPLHLAIKKKNLACQKLLLEVTDLTLKNLEKKSFFEIYEPLDEAKSVFFEFLSGKKMKGGGEGWGDKFFIKENAPEKIQQFVLEVEDGVILRNLKLLEKPENLGRLVELRRTVFPQKRNLLHLLAVSGVSQSLRWALKDGKFFSSPSDEEGWAPLHLAVKEGKVEAVKVLVESGTNMDIPNQMARTPLHVACEWGFVDIVRILMEAGAKPDKCDRFKRTADDYASPEILKVLRKYRLLKRGARRKTPKTPDLPHLSVACGLEQSDACPSESEIPSDSDIMQSFHLQGREPARTWRGGVHASPPLESILEGEREFFRSGGGEKKDDEKRRMSGNALEVPRKLLPLKPVAEETAPPPPEPSTISLPISPPLCTHDALLGEDTKEKAESLKTWFMAAQCGVVEDMRSLLDRGLVQVDCKDEDRQWTALHHAAFMGIVRL